MNNFDRNTRTLIVSFLIAIFALIPLRFIEVGTQQSLLSQTQVLGETINVDMEKEEQAIENEAKLEAPYNELEASSNGLETCIGGTEVKTAEDEVIRQLQSQNLNKEQIMVMLDELKKIELSACR